MSVEPIVSKITSKYIKVFFAGHIGISLLLLTMSFLTGKTVFLILWIITGFGGGAVYTISAVAKDSGGYEKTSMTIAENIGHVCGLAVAVVSAYLFDSFSLRIVLLLGATSAFLAVLSMCKIIRKENLYENISY